MQNDIKSIIHSNKPVFTAPLIGGGIAVLINSLLFLIFSSFNTFPVNVLMPFTKLPLSLVDVILWSFVPVFFAIPVLIYLYKTSNNPFKLFTFITFAVLAISMIAPTTLDYVTLQMIVSLEIMQILAALSIYSAVSRAVNK